MPATVLLVRPFAQGYLSISFNDTYYQLAATPGRNPGVPPLTEAQLSALQAFREVADSVKLDFWLQPGDLQVVHNQTQVHNRSAYEDHDVSYHMGSLCTGPGVALLVPRQGSKQLLQGCVVRLCLAKEKI